MAAPQITYPTGEAPKWQGLRAAIQAYYAALLPPLATLRAAVFAVFPRLTPTKADLPGEPPFFYFPSQRILIDHAVEIFLREMAGEDRSMDGFISPEGDGILQERAVFTYKVGLQRGADLVNADQMMEVARGDPAVRAMLEHAFERMSENGRLGLEGIGDQVHSVLTSAQAAGLNPLETARQLTAEFDQLKGWEFQRLARTESAYAAIDGSRDQMMELGVTQVEWLTSADACPVCQSFVGQRFSIEDTNNHPPGHPNCVCDLVNVAPEGG